MGCRVDALFRTNYQQGMPHTSWPMGERVAGMPTTVYNMRHRSDPPTSSLTSKFDKFDVITLIWWLSIAE